MQIITQECVDQLVEVDHIELQPCSTEKNNLQVPDVTPVVTQDANPVVIRNTEQNSRKDQISLETSEVTPAVKVLEIDKKRNKKR